VGDLCSSVCAVARLVDAGVWEEEGGKVGCEETAEEAVEVEKAFVQKVLQLEILAFLPEAF